MYVRLKYCFGASRSTNNFGWSRIPRSLWGKYRKPVTKGAQIAQLKDDTGKVLHFK